MGTLLPFWLLVAPAVLILVDAIISPKTSAMGSKGIASSQPPHRAAAL